jgi:hypothetical protein
MLRLQSIAIPLLVLATIATSAVPAPIITLSTSTLTRPQNGVTYEVIDFFWTNSPGAEFTNYDITVTATTGLLHDPVRQQDDRQYNSTNESANSGSVDTWVNTVMSSAAKDDAGYTATISMNPAFYQATGTGAAPGFTKLQWAVFDVNLEDDNDLSDHSDGGYSATAPYHIARILASLDASGLIGFRAFDTATPNGANYVFYFPGDNFLGSTTFTWAVSCRLAS